MAYLEAQTETPGKQAFLSASLSNSLSIGGIILLSIISAYILFHSIPLHWTKTFFREYTSPFRYESYTTALIMAGILITSFLSKKVYLKAIASALILFNVFLTASSWLNYDFFREFITSNALLMLPDMISGKAGSGLSELPSYLYTISILLYTPFFLIALWWLSAKIQPASYSKIVTAYISISLIWISVLQYRYYTDDPSARPYYNPVIHSQPIAFFYKSFFTAPPKLTEDHLVAAKFLHSTVPNPEYPLLQLTGKSTSIANPKNVILIMLESVRSAETGFFGGIQPSVTPHLDAIASQSTSFINFYANSSHTIRGEIASLCSIHDMSRGAPTARRGLPFNALCLPKILKRLNYDTLWFHGYKRKFYSRDTFHPLLGFDELHSLETMLDYNPNLKSVGWGISDNAMFNYAFEHLAKRTRPFFAEILTLSNHFPFDNDFPALQNENPKNSELYNNYLRSIHYTDKALGTFWKKFSASPLADNTIVVIVADHGIWLSSAEDDAKNAYLQHEMQFRIPMLIWEKGNTPAIKTTISSQLDITPTLLDKLGIKTKYNQFIGQDLFNHNRRELAIFSGFGSFASRDKNTFCFPDVEERKDGYYEFKTKEDRQKLKTLGKHCVIAKNDILFDRAQSITSTTNANLPIYQHIVEMSDIILLNNKITPPRMNNPL